MSDLRIPAGIDAAIRRAATALPAQAWDLDSLRRRAHAVHRLRRTPSTAFGGAGAG
jgi:hypothetical protein